MHIDYSSGTSAQQPQRLTFSEDMSSEELILWLPGHPKLAGTDYQRDIYKLKGMSVYYCYNSLILTLL